MSITEEQINEQAVKVSMEYVTKYAPSSYKADFVDGAKWTLKQLEQWTTHTSSYTEK